jgi:tetratricopeptide (TPR) repeat protein
MSRIVTFYSYKGGVGRTFALANVAVLLAKRRQRVLLMDWDLEAPGLHRYFTPHLSATLLPTQGIIQLLGDALQDPRARWEPLAAKITLGDNLTLSIIPSGDQDPDYVERVRDFSWKDFFENRQGGEVLDRWRKEWKQAFDFVLIDSRTGITDTGGVCTVFLPDILVFVFSANEQSFGRGVQVMLGVQEARRKLAVPRPPAAILPLPGRFDGRDEVDEAKTWLDRFSRELKPFYDDWLPKQFEPRQILELTKTPYITKFSFGEPLAVLTHGTSDPEFPGFYLENVARLLVSSFREARHILAPEEIESKSGIAQLRARLAQVPIDEAGVTEALSRLESEVIERADLSEVLNEAGVALLRQGLFDSAESCFRRALAISDREVGTEHPSTIVSLNHLAELLQSTSRVSEAAELYRRALDLLAHTSQPDDPAVTAAYTNLAAVLRETGQLNEAEELYRRALDTLEVSARFGDAATASVYNNLAAVLRDSGRLAEAEEVYRRALDTLEVSSRAGNPATASVYNNLAAALRDSGRLAEAEEVYRRALSILAISSRPGDPAVASVYNNLAVVLRESGRLAEAEEVYRRALDTVTVTARPGDPAVANAYNNLAGVLRESGRLTDAEHLLRQALEMLEPNARPDDPALAITYNHLGAVLREAGQLSEAEAVYRRALDVLEVTMRRGDPAVETVYNNLADVLREMDRLSEAEEVYRRALHTMAARSRPGDSVVARTYNNLADVVRDNGQLGEAEKIYRQVIDMQGGVTVGRSFEMAHALSNLGEVLVARGESEEAELSFRRALDYFDSAVGQDHPDAIKARSALASLLEKRGDTDEAEKVLGRFAFDTWLIFENRDRKVVRQLARELRARGVRAWLDEWELMPGASWHKELERVVQSVPSAVVCIGRSDAGSRLSPEVDAYLRLYARMERPIIPVLLPGAPEKLELPLKLARNTWVDLHEGITKEGIDRLTWGITGRRPRIE